MWLFLFVNFYVASWWCRKMGNNLFRKLFLSLTSSSFLSSLLLGCMNVISENVWHTWWWSLSVIADDVIFYLSLPIFHLLFSFILLRWSKIEMKGMVLWYLRFLRPTHKSFLRKNYSIKFCRHRREFCRKRMMKNSIYTDLWLSALFFFYSLLLWGSSF